MCFWKPRRASVRMLCSCARTGTQPFSRIPLRMEEVGRKRYLSETPSIGWEAKTLGAKRRNSSSEIATVPGTIDLVELLFSAVLMLVDWLVGSVSRSREARLWELSEFFRRSVSVEKVCWAYFLHRKRSATEEGRKAQEPRGTRRVEDLNRRAPPEVWRERWEPGYFKPQTVLLRWRGLCGGGSNLWRWPDTWKQEWS